MPNTGNSFDKVFPVTSSFLEIELAVGNVGGRFEVLVDNEAPLSYQAVRERDSSVVLLPLPPHVFDGREHTIFVRSPAGTLIEGSPVRYQSQYQGYLDCLNEGVLVGWAIDFGRPTTPLKIAISVDGRVVALTTADEQRNDLALAPAYDRRNGFRHQLLGTLPRSFTLDVHIAGTEFQLHGSPLYFIDSAQLVTSIQQMNAGYRFLEHRLIGSNHITDADKIHFANLILEGASSADLAILRKKYLSPLEEQIKPGYVSIFYVQSSPPLAAPPLTLSATEHRNRTVDIIIPIHSGFDETMQCLASVFESECLLQFEIICILDNPDDREIRPPLEKMAAEGRITLLVNAENLGFIKSVNLGMRQHVDRDVLLLNSDTRVHADWLTRLQNAAYSSPEIGTVTPFSNNATICSYPSITQANELPSDCGDSELDNFCKTVNTGVTVNLPTGVGFCMYIRRSCLDDTGSFNEQDFGLGYGEENEFCLRARAGGWRSILAADVFVWHAGAVSFQSQKAAEVEKNLGVLHERFPYYGNQVCSFFADDPVLAARRKIDEQRLSRVEKPVHLFMLHGLGGGTERHVKEMCDAVKQSGVHPVILFSLGDGRVSLQSSTIADLPNLIYHIDREFELFVSFLRRLPIRHAHVHSNVNSDQRVLDLPSRLNIPYDCTIHDYSWFCPRLNLVNGSGKYCGQPAVDICEVCVRTNGASPAWENFPVLQSEAVRDLHKSSQVLLAGAQRVFCPSNDAMQRLIRAFTLTNVCFRPHPENSVPRLPANFARSPDQVVRVALLGRLAPHKGLTVLRDCAVYALRRKLPLKFVVVGYTSDDESFAELPNVEITGRYSDSEIDDVIQKNRLDLALIPSIWPETYSYTLSIALRNGLFPVAFDLGAVAERVRAHQYGRLVPIGSGPEIVVDALLAGAQELRETGPRAFDTSMHYADVMKDYFELGRQPCSD